MAEILDLQEQRRRLNAKRGFAAWSRRFAEAFDENTSVKTLSDPTLRRLIQGGDDSSILLHELIMGIMRLEKGATFHDLESQLKLEVMDIAFFLLDQLRFEVMRRLSWVEASPFFDIPILTLVEGFADIYAPERNHTPELLPSHPRFQEYLEAFVSDRSVFVRKLVPEALEVFQEGYAGA